MTSITRRMQRRRRFSQMFANDTGVADLLVAERELVVGKPDCTRFMSELGMFERARVKRDGARLLAARERDTAVQPPQRRQARVRDAVLQRIWRSPQRARRLSEIVLQQPGLSERTANQKLVLTIERLRAEEWLEQGSSLSPPPSLESDAGPG